MMASWSTLCLTLLSRPKLVVLGVSTAHPDPIAELTRLMDTCRQAPIFQRGFLDPEVPKYFILLHDSASSDYSASLSLFEKMKRQMNGNCHLLRINSRPEEDTSPFIEDLWRPYMVREAMLESVPREEILGSTAEGGLDGFGGGGGGTSADRPVVGDPSGGKDEDHQVDETKRCGELLSPEDVQGIRVMCKELLTQTIIPFMEQNCQIWNEQVSFLVPLPQSAQSIPTHFPYPSVPPCRLPLGEGASLEGSSRQVGVF